MADFTYKANTTFLEEKYVTWDEVGLTGPDQKVINTNNDIKSINYDGLIGLLIEAIKELKKQIDNPK